MYTVKQLSKLAGVSNRTLHYYDQIGLLKPEAYGENGYRYYGDPTLLRLQQILFFKELGLGLEEIRTIVSSPTFDVLEALQAHRKELQERVQRLEHLIGTVDNTILHLKGKQTMSKIDLFEGFSEEQEKEYQKEARRRWGPWSPNEVKDWNSYTPAQKAAIKAEGEENYRALLEYIEQGKTPASAEVQQVVARWHQHLRYFYEPSVERMRGLGDLYNDDPQFRTTFTRIHPQLPEFMRAAIQVYCDKLEEKK